MKSVKWSLLVTTAAITSLVLTITIQQQNVAAFNEKNNELVSNFHNHLKCNDECGGSSGSVSNTEDQHSNTNCSDNSNSPQRDETSCKTNSHDKPDNDD
jgi:hypothetical protein